MHKWLQMPATPTDDPLATVYPINHYKKSHVYAVTRINPIYVDDEFRHETWNKSGSSGYESQPHSDHSSLDKNSPPAAKCLRHGRRTTPPSSPSDGSSGDGSLQLKTPAPWLSPIKEGVIDVHQYCIPRPVWPGHDDNDNDDGDDDDDDDGGGYDASRRLRLGTADLRRIPRVKCCRHCTRCRCRSNGGGSNGMTTGGSYSGYSSAYGGSAGGTISTNSTSTSASSGGGGGSCSDDAVPLPGSASVNSNRHLHLQSPLVLDPRFGDGIAVHKTLMDNWNPVDLRLNQKTDNLHYDCGAMLRGLQFTLDAQQAEKLMKKIKVGKKHRCWCRLVTACLGLIMFLVSVITVSLTLTRGQKMFGSL